MQLQIASHLVFNLPVSTDVLLQIEAAPIPEQAVTGPLMLLTPTEHTARVPADEAIGDRVWLRARGQVRADYTATVEITRAVPEIAGLPQLPAHLLPGPAIPYLFSSRYCQATSFETLVQDDFGATEGGARVLAIRDWIAAHFTYTSGSSGPETTALDSYVERRGVCRDYAHVLIALARASGIPARYASVYAPNVTPQDFHAVAEVFLAEPDEQGGAWHLIDATGMAHAGEMAKIGVGRDAADVSFLTSFGQSELLDKEVSVTIAG